MLSGGGPGPAALDGPGEEASGALLEAAPRLRSGGGPDPAALDEPGEEAWPHEPGTEELECTIFGNKNTIYF